MQRIVEELVEKANAIGAWVLNGPHELAGSTTDPTITAPRGYADGEAYVAVGNMGIFMEPVGSVLLLVLFDAKSTLGLVRLRVKQAKAALIRELTE